MASSDIKIPEQARQRSKNPARFGPVNRLYDPTELFRNIFRHARQTNKQTYFTQLGWRKVDTAIADRMSTTMRTGAAVPIAAHWCRGAGEPKNRRS